MRKKRRSTGVMKNSSVVFFTTSWMNLVLRIKCSIILTTTRNPTDSVKLTEAWDGALLCLNTWRPKMKVLAMFSRLVITFLSGLRPSTRKAENLTRRTDVFVSSTDSSTLHYFFLYESSHCDVVVEVITFLYLRSNQQKKAINLECDLRVEPALKSFLK